MNLQNDKPRADQFIKEVVSHLKELAAETDNVKKSEFFKHYLETMSKFWRYSYHNQLLINYQMPKASRVAGFRKWRQLGRWVRKGSKAIRILAPHIKKIHELDENGELIEKEEVEGFILVGVFDVSQTEGKPLPDVDITVDGDSHKSFLDGLVEFCGTKKIKVDFRALGVNGLYGYSKGGQIAVTNAESINTQVNTLIHEVAHELLHQKNLINMGKQRKEIQAEGVAYVVTKHFGMESKSFNYLALYSANYKRIMENMKVIAGTSRQIIEFLEGQILPVEV